MTFCIRMFLVAIFFASLNIGWARSEEPAALIEEVSPDIHSVSIYDYVSVGSQIDLGTDGRITLGYLAACAEETIQGGRLTVGNKGSAVAGGHLDRQLVPCPVPIRPTPTESSQSGAMVFRAPPVVPLRTIYPIITLPAPGRVVIKTVSGNAEQIDLETEGRVIDLAGKGPPLRLSTTYRIEYAGRQIVVRVMATATALGPVFARLIRF
jgi:hypothetical protein